MIDFRRIEYLRCEAERAVLSARYVVAKAESDRLFELLLAANDVSYRAELALVAASLEVPR